MFSPFSLSPRLSLFFLSILCGCSFSLRFSTDLRGKTTYPPQLRSWMQRLENDQTQLWNCINWIISTQKHQYSSRRFSNLIDPFVNLIDLRVLHLFKSKCRFFTVMYIIHFYTCHKHNVYEGIKDPINY